MWFTRKKNTEPLSSRYEESEVAEFNSKFCSLELKDRLCVTEDHEVRVYRGIEFTKDGKCILVFNRIPSMERNMSSCFDLENSFINLEYWLEYIQAERNRFILLRDQLKKFGYEITELKNDNR